MVHAHSYTYGVLDQRSSSFKDFSGIKFPLNCLTWSFQKVLQQPSLNIESKNQGGKKFEAKLDDTQSRLAALKLWQDAETILDRVAVKLNTFSNCAALPFVAW